MNLLFLNHNVIWRSTFFRCYHFGRYLVRRGHKVTIYTIHPHNRRGVEEVALQGVRVVQFPDLLWGMGRSGWDAWDLWHRLQHLRRETFDVVHAFDSRPVVIHPAMRLKRKGLPMFLFWAYWWGRGGVISERSNPLLKYGFGGIETWYEEHFRTRADRTTVISSALQKRVEGLGVKPDTVLKLTGGADVENFTPRDKAAARKALGLGRDLKIVGFMGFVHYDLELALRAFGRLYRQDKSCRLILVGKTSPLTHSIAQAADCEDGILEYGIVPYDKIPDYMGCADVFLLPFSNKQANIGRWPNKVGDYMAMARPIVSSPVGEMAVLFKDEAIGQLAPDHPEGFAATAAELLEQPALCEKLGESARRAAESKYSWEFLSERLETLYQGLLAR